MFENVNWEEARMLKKEQKNLWSYGMMKIFLQLLWQQEEIFLAEILEYLDFNKISKSKLKWIQGYSNITVISFVFYNYAGYCNNIWTKCKSIWNEKFI